MTERLIAYLLDELSAQERIELEDRLGRDPELARQLRQLRECFEESSRTAGDDAPPLDLVRRTCCYVEESDDDWGRREAAPASGSSTKTMSPAAAAPCGPCRWTLLDTAIAASVLLAAAALVAPTLCGSRDSARRLACQENLQWLGGQLFSFQERFNHQLPKVAPGQPSATYVLQLATRGGVDLRELAQRLACPDSPDADEFRRELLTTLLHLQGQGANSAATARQLASLAAGARGPYAYRIGFFDPRGRFHTLTFTGDQRLPLLSDAPTLTQHGVTASSHAGGWNVLHECLSVRFRTRCTLPATGDHIFLNQQGQHAAGQGPNDVVLTRIDYGPTGAATERKSR